MIPHKPIHSQYSRAVPIEDKAMKKATGTIMKPKKYKYVEDFLNLVMQGCSSA
jgi:hypothetical protein